MNLHELTIAEASEKLAKGEITSVELTEAVLNRIKKIDPKVGAYITVTADKALEMANESDFRRKAGKTLGKLDGIPIAVKDLFLTKGIKTTAGSKILDDFIPAYESTVTKKLWQAGAVLVGKTNLDEFAMGSSTETSAYKTATECPHPNPLPPSVGEGVSTTRNPWDLTRVPGGSSGGSAAAVSADLCLGAVGTDTGGSIRQPSAMCGITGLKPTYGRVSRYGTMAMASSLDQAGPMGKTVEDIAIILEAISGCDKFDATSSEKIVPNYLESISNKQLEMNNLRIGIPAEFYGQGMDPDVEKVVRDAAVKFEKMGATLVPVSIPMVKYALAAYYIIVPAEVSSNLARYDGVRFGCSLIKTGKPANALTCLPADLRDYSILDVYNKSRESGFGAEAKRRIMLGSFVLSAGYYDAYYKKAQQIRTLIKVEFKKVFEKVDILLTPVSPTPAFKFEEKTEDPLTMYLADIHTVPINPAGLPALSLPAGSVNRDGKDLPVGVQLIGGWWDEQTLLNAGHAFQQETDFHLNKPEIN